MQRVRKLAINLQILFIGNYMLKRFIVIFIFTGLIATLSACSSDPYENAGKCSRPGEVKAIDERLAICIGENNKYKYYFQGKYFEDALLASKIIFQLYGWDTENPYPEQYSNFGLNGDDVVNLMSSDLGDITMSDLANFAGDDPRWDDLLESRAKFEAAEEENTYLRTERYRLIGDYQVGKATRIEAFEAQSKHQKYFEGPYSDAVDDYQSKLEVVRALITSKYALNDEDELMVFLTLYALPNRL